MILSYLTHKKWQWQTKGIKLIATNSSIAYRDLVQGFQSQKDSLLCTSDHYEQLEISKTFDFVGDLLLSGDVTKKYLAHIVKSYITNLDEDNRNKIMIAFHHLEATVQVEATVQDSLLLEDLPLEIDFDEDLRKSLKMLNVHLDQQMLLDPCAITKTVLKIHEICHLKTIPVVCNLANYLELQELSEINQLVNELNLTFIVLEFVTPDLLKVPLGVQFYYIDEDLVDWY
ncbi:type II-A CRISPR-associated protein Csn2 [Bombilactobacillus folatiphilus]|uniref:Type II-A CRISPR-associated protein Csn2 n=1 Tax=Bombilactobacillus folatiphilus TaxID=2923362 RepID=A0ABY4PC24_9LACO|nr:type II-A CRISPR-associated protein Csn2 [Bombilactobacillus folatiphilus]UQS82812.1 type II-A CRISPR-associated protein Csn2 [Bombilactobacillus folatiphilus]